MTTTSRIANDNGVSPAPRGWRKWGWVVLAAPLLLGGVTYRATQAQAQGFGSGEDGGPAMHQHMQQRMDRILTAAGATDSQKAQIKAIWAGLQPQLKAAHQDHAKLRQQIEQAMTAPNIDTAAIEKLRQQSVQAMDRTSALFTQGMVRSAQVLTPDQRQKVLTEMHNEHHRRGAGGE
jgi:Spy/CpxP family protein refolding chaperone